MLSQVIGDAKTSVTSLGGAIGGVASDKIANMVLAQVGLGNNKAGLGDVGLRFIIRAATTSLVFGGMSYLLPETSENIFFSIVFFAGNRALVSDAVLFGQILTKGVVPMLPAPTGKGGKSEASCACKH
jgi:hypothetical protein